MVAVRKGRGMEKSKREGTTPLIYTKDPPPRTPSTLMISYP
jgi:hypothetical protein